MSDGVYVALTLGSALGSGLMAGIFYAFSAMVMPGLRRLPPARAMAAMQATNEAVYNAWFMTVFLGTAGLSVVSGIIAVARWGEDESPYLLAGALLYLIGSIGLTGGYHVPRNNALATADPDAAETPERWARYEAEWTRWNHVRAAACLVATAAFVGALMVA